MPEIITQIIDILDLSLAILVPLLQKLTIINSLVITIGTLNIVFIAVLLIRTGKGTIQDLKKLTNR